MDLSNGRAEHLVNATAQRQISPPPREANLPTISLSHLILKHITKLRINDGATDDDGADHSSYHLRTTAALFLANVHYLLYACGLIQTHVGHLVKESALEHANPPGLKQNKQQKNRKVLIDNLATLEHHVQRAVSSASVSTGAATTTVPMALVLGPSPISPRRVYYMEQRIRPCSTSQTEQDALLPAHSLLPTWTRSSLCLSLHRFLMSNCQTDAMKRGTKVYIFIMQPVEWKCPGWHRRHGININLSSLAVAEDGTASDEEKSSSPCRGGPREVMSPTPEEISRTPSPALGTPLRRLRLSQPHSPPPSLTSSCSCDPRPPGSRLKMSSASAGAFKLRTSTANGTGMSLRLANSTTQKKRTSVAGFKMDSCGHIEQQQEERQEGMPSVALAWFQCETVISGCV